MFSNTNERGGVLSHSNKFDFLVMMLSLTRKPLIVEFSKVNATVKSSKQLDVFKNFIESTSEHCGMYRTPSLF